MKGKCRLNSIHKLWILLMSIFFIASSVSAAIDFDSPCYSVPENKYYYEHGGQCTAFAWGRACETTGIKLEFEIQSYPSAKYWYEYGPIDSLNLQLGSDIRPNSIAIWEGDTANPYGHVAYIERVEGGIVYFNEANVETYDGSTWGGGYDGYEKSSTIYNFEHRGTGIGDILGYLYLTAPFPQENSLVRIEGQDPIYWLQNGKAYHILSFDIIDAMAELPGWGGDKIYVYPEDVLEIVSPGNQSEDTFEQGPDFISTNPESNDLLIQLTDDPKVYLIEDGERRWITTEAVFT